MGLMYGVGTKAKRLLEINNPIDLIADNGYNASTDIARCYAEQMTAHVSMDAEGFDVCIETEEEAARPATHWNGRCSYIENRKIDTGNRDGMTRTSYRFSFFVKISPPFRGLGRRGMLRAVAFDTAWGIPRCRRGREGQLRQSRTTKAKLIIL